MAIAIKGKPSTMLTLTVNPKAFASEAQAAEALVVGFRRMREAIKERGWSEKFPFMAFFERHKSGWPHLHILCRVPFISQRWISAYFDRRISSPIVDIRRIKGRRQAAAYTAKYLAKDPHRYEGRKRQWRNQSYIGRQDRRPPSEYPWQMCLLNPQDYEARMIRYGYQIVSRTGDLVEMITAPP